MVFASSCRVLTIEKPVQRLNFIGTTGAIGRRVKFYSMTTSSPKMYLLFFNGNLFDAGGFIKAANFCGVSNQFSGVRFNVPRAGGVKVAIKAKEKPSCDEANA